MFASYSSCHPVVESKLKRNKNKTIEWHNIYIFLVWYYSIEPFNKNIECGSRSAKNALCDLWAGVPSCSWQNTTQNLSFLVRLPSIRTFNLFQGEKGKIFGKIQALNITKSSWYIRKLLFALFYFNIFHIFPLSNIRSWIFFQKANGQTYSKIKGASRPPPF